MCWCLVKLAVIHNFRVSKCWQACSTAAYALSEMDPGIFEQDSRSDISINARTICELFMQQVLRRNPVSSPWEWQCWHVALFSCWHTPATETVYGLWNCLWNLGTACETLSFCLSGTSRPQSVSTEVHVHCPECASFLPVWDWLNVGKMAHESRPTEKSLLMLVMCLLFENH